MKDRSALYINHIKQHYSELRESLKSINDDYYQFIDNIIIQKAVKMDLLQIGELVNNLPDDVKNQIDKRDVRGIVDIRNYIAHGYVSVDNKEIWTTIYEDMPRLMKSLSKINTTDKNYI